MIPEFDDGRDWFLEKRFGMFIHWGIYSVNAWHEQEQYRRGLPRSDYVPLMEKFNPEDFNPDEWLDIAEKTGMRYICFTAKHVDGFCMWDTSQTSYNIINTPYGRDILLMLAEACHRRNFPLCIYYSVPDMHCKYYPNQGRSYELPAPEDGDEPDVGKYVEFVKAQVRELCTNYGKIHGFWWDGNRHTLKLQDESINKLIRSLQAGIIINNRGFDEGDFSTPEREYEYYSNLHEQRTYNKPIEACESIGKESWGYRKNEDYFSTGYLTRSIDEYLVKGGNYLLNVGPKSDGTLPNEAIGILGRIGTWYHKTKEAFTDTKPVSYMTDNKDILFTKRENILYVHLFREPKSSGIILNPIDTLPQKATVLNNGQKLDAAVELMPTLFKDRKKYLHIWNIPVDELSNEAIVIKLEFESFPDR